LRCTLQQNGTKLLLIRKPQMYLHWGTGKKKCYHCTRPCSI